MKYYYKKPEMNKIEFAANEYIAACFSSDDSGFVACKGSDKEVTVGCDKVTVDKHGFALKLEDMVAITKEDGDLNVEYCGYPNCSYEESQQTIKVADKNSLVLQYNTLPEEELNAYKFTNVTPNIFNKLETFLPLGTGTGGYTAYTAAS